MSHPQESRPARSWRQKFADAFRGIREGVRGQSSFFVHFWMIVAVMAAAAVLKVTLAEWCLLLICITMVLAAEMFNSALESFARAVAPQWDPHLGRALDIGSGAVLIAAIGAAIVGTLIFAHRLGPLDWW